jgi:hypothetical protein
MKEEFRKLAILLRQLFAVLFTLSAPPTFVFASGYGLFFTALTFFAAFRLAYSLAGFLSEKGDFLIT